MKLVKEIEFRVKTENEAFQKVRDKLGSDGIILSIQTVRVPSLIPFFRKKELVVRAGILEEEKQAPVKERDPELDRKQMEVFKALLEYKKSLPKEESSPQDLQERLLESVEDSVEIRSGSDPGEPLPGKIHVQEKEEPGQLQEKAFALEQLLENEMPLDCAEMLWNEFSSISDNTVSFRNWLHHKCRDICFQPGEDMLTSALGGNRIMIVGPTGVGKTTTIAKIAAIAVQEGRDVALFTSDNYRVSAVDQIRTFARVLHIPLEAVNQGSEVPGLLSKYSKDTLILMDTPGHGFREKDRISQIESIYRNFSPQAVHIAVSATSRPSDAKAAIENTGEVAPLSRLLLTKADETMGLGCLLALPFTFNLPLSFITTGQNVPRDINYATPDFLMECIFGRSEGI